MLFKDIKPGDCILLPDDGVLYVTSSPKIDDVTGELFVSGELKTGQESNYFADSETLVKTSNNS